VTTTTGPSIKGVVLELAIEAVRDLLESGRLRREQLEVRLTADDLALLDQKIVPGMWYPIATLGRLLEISTREQRIEGGMDAVVEVGVRAAKRLFSSQIYKTYASGLDGQSTRAAGLAFTRLAPLLCNFTHWSYDAGPENGDTFSVEVENAAEFPELLRYIAQGVIQYLGERVNQRPVKVSSRRPTPDRILYKGVRSAK
jgi:hypothetical protein